MFVVSGISSKCLNGHAEKPRRSNILRLECQSWAGGHLTKRPKTHKERQSGGGVGGGLVA